MSTGGEVPHHWDYVIWGRVSRLWRVLRRTCCAYCMFLHTSMPTSASLRYWNALVDEQARLSNQNRAYDFSKLHSKARQWTEHMTACVQAMRGIYIRIAEATHKRERLQSAGEVVEPYLPEAISVEPPGQLLDRVPICWKQTLQAGPCHLAPSFVVPGVVMGFCDLLCHVHHQKKRLVSSKH